MATRDPFDADVQAFLRRFGWHEDYFHDSTGWVDWLTQEGFAVTPLAVEIMERLGGVSISPNGNNEVFFSIFEAPDLIPDFMTELAGLLETPVTPVADWQAMQSLLAGGDGAVYACYATYVFKVGNDLNSALRKVLLDDGEITRIWRREKVGAPWVKPPD